MLALAGGVGGAKLANGLAQIAGSSLTVIVNTADDFDHCGLRICPDLDTVMYTLAGIGNAETGWGVNGESWNFLEQMRVLGGPNWFQLGDRDLATHVIRSARLRDGERLTEITADFLSKLRIASKILPMTDNSVSTMVLTESGELGFQDYFVRLRCEVPVKGFRFAGMEYATISPEIDAALSGMRDITVICPSNPFVSIDPILSIPGLRGRLAGSSRSIIAVSPIIGGKAVKGPAAKMMGELNIPVSSVSVAERYRGLIHGLIIDHRDSEEAARIEALGIRVKITNTLMMDRAGQRDLAEQCVRFGRELAG